ncbi:DUF6265 family protein [Ulvibacterium sp.]|uniref:DUF6265 family protein n=1 Tax=Ulvibacterium sp. TaxID=2665914 RepID=UPI003BACEBF7
MQNFKAMVLMQIVISIFLLVSQATSQGIGDKSNVPEYAWLAGNWSGNGFGGTSEESWSLPSPDGTMMGMYRHLDSIGNITFYEFLLLDETGIRLKHFRPDLIGWETKEDFVTFEMVRYNGKIIELKGLIFKRKSENEMEILLKLRKGDVVKTEVFKMKKINKFK